MIQMLPHIGTCLHMISIMGYPLYKSVNGISLNTIENTIQYHSMVFASNKANGILNGIFRH